MSGSELWDAKYRADQLTRADLDLAERTASVQAAFRYLRPRMKVLEAGSGTGRLALSLARRAEVSVTAVDLSEESLLTGRRLAEVAAPLSGTVTFVRADLYDLPFSAGSFDVVLSDSVIEHLDDPDAVLWEFRRVLRAGGLAIVSVPNRWRPDGWDLYRRLARPPYRQESFTPPRLRAAMRRAGLQPIEMFGDEVWLARNLTLLRRLRSGPPPPRPSGRTQAVPRRGLLRLRSGVRRIADAALPSWLHVNIGVVAERR